MTDVSSKERSEAIKRTWHFTAIFTSLKEPKLKKKKKKKEERAVVFPSFMSQS
jgi:hypothetical protein